jgi:hypothetical protein
MPYYVWMMANGLFILGSALYIWMFQPYHSTVVLFGKLFAQIAIVLFAVNINMYFIFLVIRKSKNRAVKVRLSKMARKMMKAHIPIAIIGTSLIVLHAGMMALELGKEIGFFHPKMLTGYLGVLLLVLTLFAGWLRHKKASGFRRKFHLTMALIFGGVFIVHLFFPL